MRRLRVEVDMSPWRHHHPARLEREPFAAFDQDATAINRIAEHRTRQRGFSRCQVTRVTGWTR
jgi:hypothetical protein